MLGAVESLSKRLYTLLTCAGHSGALTRAVMIMKLELTINCRPNYCDYLK